MPDLLENLLGRSSSMVLKSSGERIVFVNRWWSSSILIVLACLLLLAFALEIILAELFLVLIERDHKLGFLVAGLLAGVLAGVSYRKVYVFDSRRREAVLTRRFLFLTRTRRIPFDRIESISVRLSRRPLPGVMCPARVDNYQLWIKLKTGRDVYLDMASDRGLISNWRELLQSTLGQRNDDDERQSPA